MPERVEAAHDQLSALVITTAGAIDRAIDRAFPGPPQPIEEPPVGPRLPDSYPPKSSQYSRVRISPEFAYSDSKKLQFRCGFGARLDLPRLENRVQLVANNSPDETDVLTDFNDVAAREQRLKGENDKQAGLRLILVDQVRYGADTSFGMRFKPEPVPKARLKGRMAYYEGFWMAELAQIGFWEQDNGFGEKSEITIELNLSRRLLLRNTGAAVVEEKTSGVMLGETASLLYALPHDRTIGIKGGVRWHTKPAAAIDNYSVRLPYRQRLWKDWVFIKIEPGAEFPDATNYKMDPLISVSLDLFFGGEFQH